jgi:hypothetical protein
MASDSTPNGQGEAAPAPDGVGGPAARVEIEPMETNDVLIVAVGTALFAVASAILLPMHASLSHSGHGRWPWIALSGFLLGLLGLVYCRRRAQRISKVNAQ